MDKEKAIEVFKKEWQDVMVNCFGPMWLKEYYSVSEIGAVAKYCANIENQRNKFAAQEDRENKLQAENKKLRECVEFLLKEKYSCSNTSYDHLNKSREKARQCLKELGE